MSKPVVRREFFSDLSVPLNSPGHSVPYWHWSHETDECFDTPSSDGLYDTMQAAFRASVYHLRNECEAR